MSGPILCYNCGGNLGEVYKFIEIAVEYHIKKETGKLPGYSPEQIKHIPSLISPIGYILDAADCYKICCRTHLMTVKRYNVEFN